jgi:hypothetical protein
VSVALFVCMPRGADLTGRRTMEENTMAKKTAKKMTTSKKRRAPKDLPAGKTVRGGRAQGKVKFNEFS